jgi:S1-C subfamily serine protease
MNALRLSWSRQFTLAVCIFCSSWFASRVHAQVGLPPSLVANVQKRLVKINGSGGIQGLESYQTGILISADGHVLTVWSYVLDSDRIKATLHDGRRYSAKVLNYDPRSEIAVLKIDERDLPFFDLNKSKVPDVGAMIVVGSNLFGVATGDEPVSVMRGVVQATTPLRARRGQFEVPYQDEVLIVDAITNNPGAAGGAVTDLDGNLIGMIGKEAECRLTDTWLNYAFLTSKLAPEIRALIDGNARPIAKSRRPDEPMSLSLLGIQLVTNVVHRTPPFVDRVVAEQPAEAAGLRPDDLIVELNGEIVPTIDELVAKLSLVSRDSPVRLTIQRNGELKSLQIRVR